MIKKNKSYVFFSVLIFIFLLVNCVIWSSCRQDTESQPEIKEGQKKEVAAPKAKEPKEEGKEIPSKNSGNEEKKEETSGNLVSVSFIEESNYKAPGDSFKNKEVTIERWWRTNLINISDKTGKPVTGLKLRLKTDMSFDGIEEDQLARMGPQSMNGHWMMSLTASI